MRNDPWLEKWLPLIREASAAGPMLELGCGPGWDTVDLLAAVPEVIATDISAENLAECARCAPGVQLVRLDIAQPLPFAGRSLPLVLASLSLHYFPWDTTLRIAAELRRCIRPGGMLVARFNSTHDLHHGAASPLEIEPDFYQVGVWTKRFFDEASVRLFLQGWEIQFLEENVIHRYEKPKYVWEVRAVNLPLDTSPPPS